MPFEYFVRLSSGQEITFSQIEQASLPDLLDWTDDVQQSLLKIRRQLDRGGGTPEWRNKALRARFAYCRGLSAIMAQVQARPPVDVVQALVTRARNLSLDPPTPQI